MSFDGSRRPNDTSNFSAKFFQLNFNSINFKLSSSYPYQTNDHLRILRIIVTNGKLLQDLISLRYNYLPSYWIHLSLKLVHFLFAGILVSRTNIKKSVINVLLNIPQLFVLRKLFEHHVTFRSDHAVPHFCQCEFIKGNHYY